MSLSSDFAHPNVVIFAALSEKTLCSLWNLREPDTSALLLPVHLLFIIAILKLHVYGYSEKRTNCAKVLFSNLIICT